MATAGYRGYTPQQMRWLMNYASGSQTDISDPMYQQMLGKGAITISDPMSRTVGAYSNETGSDPGHEETYYNIAPTFELPKLMGGTSNKAAGWTLAYDPAHGFNEGSVPGSGGQYTDLFYDPVYGAVHRYENKRDIMDTIAPMLATGMALGPMAAALAPGIAAATGIPEWLAGSLIKAAPGVIASGGQNIGSAAAGIAGAATGIPGGSTLGSMAYNAATDWDNFVAPLLHTGGSTPPPQLRGPAFNPTGQVPNMIPGMTDLGIPPQVWESLNYGKGGVGLFNSTFPPKPVVPPGPTTVQNTYYPELYGDMNMLPAVGQSGDELAAKAVVPDAYNNSYGANSQVIV